MSDNNTNLEQSRRVRELTLLYTISKQLDQSLDLRDIVSPVLEALAEHMDMQYATLTLLNRQTGDILIEDRPTASSPQTGAARPLQTRRRGHRPGGAPTASDGDSP
jgi:nitrate/nitrite-specific signal transduction histidine kinase